MHRALMRRTPKPSPMIFAATLALLMSLTFGCGYGNKPSGPGAAAPRSTGAAANVLPPKDPKPLDLAYIPADAVLAVVLDPYQLRKSPNLADLKADSFNQQIAADTGIDATKIAQLMIIGGLQDQGPPISYGFIVRFNQPCSREAVLANLVPEGETAKEGEREYHRARPPSSLAVCFADDKTLLVAPEPSLKKMLAAKDVKSPLISELAKQNDAAAALAVLAVEPIRGKLQGMMFLGAIPKPPQPADGLLKTVQHVSVVEIKLDVTPQLAVRGRIRAKNAESAAEVQKIVNEVLDKTKSMLAEAAKGGGGASLQDGQIARLIQMQTNRFFAALTQNRDKDLLVYEAEGDGVQAQFGLFGRQFVQEYHNSHDRALKNETLAKLKQVGTAMLAYETAQGKFPSPAIYAADGKPLLSWRVQLLPYLDDRAQALFKEFKLNEPWDSPHNKPLVARIPNVYRTPGRPRDGKTCYLAPIDKTTVFRIAEGVNRSEITDGVSNTVAIVQVGLDRAVEWTRPDDLAFDAASPLVSLGSPQLSGEMTGLREGIPAVFADGSARLLKWNMEPKELSTLFTRSGGEKPPKEL